MNAECHVLYAGSVQNIMIKHQNPGSCCIDTVAVDHSHPSRIISRFGRRQAIAIMQISGARAHTELIPGAEHSLLNWALQPLLSEELIRINLRLLTQEKLLQFRWLAHSAMILLGRSSSSEFEYLAGEQGDSDVPNKHHSYQSTYSLATIRGLDLLFSSAGSGSCSTLCSFC